MHNINGWNIPQQGDKFNTNWAQMYDDFLSKYATIVNSATNEIVFNLPSHDANAFTLSGSNGHIMVVDTTNSATPTLKYYGSVSATSGIWDGSYRVYSDGNKPNLSVLPGQISISAISATGVLTSATYLRGDSTWAPVVSMPSTGALSAVPNSVITVTNGSNAVIGNGTGITISQATSASNGYLTSSDWVLFNNKGNSSISAVGTLSASPTSVISVVGGTSAVLGSGVALSISQATSTTNGYVSSGDWVNFNSKLSPSTSGQFALSAHNQAWSTISATPTTLSGYGITDALNVSTSGQFSLSGHNHVISTLTGTLPVTMISATGSPSSTTYLRGDGSWSTVSGGGGSGTFGALSAIPTSVITITNGLSAVNGVGTGITISQATSTTNGYVSSGDWITFNGKMSPSTSGQFALSAHNQAWSTISATPTTLSGYGITDALNVSTSAQFALSGHTHPNATSAVTGFLTSADWSTFNNKVGSITSADLSASPTSVITVTGGTKAVLGSGVSIAISQATSTTNGYVSSGDWITFNGKLSPSTSGQFALSAHNQAWTTISATPTTLSGYGITDALNVSTSGQFALSGHTHPNATSAVTGFLTSADWTAFNNKVGSITSADLSASPTSVITVTGGTKAVLGSGVSISIAQATSSTNGYVSSGDWVNFNSKLASSTSGQFALSAHNQAWFTISATPTTLSGYGITDALNVSTSGQFALSGHTHPNATSAVTGFLTSADWNTFNNKIGSITSADLSASPASVITVTGGTKAVLGSGVSISIAQATSSTNGYVSSGDWNTFNSKFNAASSAQFALSAHNQAGSTITNTPTTLSGYGITDALNVSTSGQFSLSGHNHVISTLTGTLPVTMISATGTPSSITYLRGDGSWSTVSGGGGGSGTYGTLSATPNSVITITNGLSAVNGAGTGITISQVSSTTNGFLTSSDWVTFNSKLDQSTSGQFALSGHNHSLSALNGQLPISMISATGSLTSATYLRGDGTWAFVGSSVGAVNTKQTGTFNTIAGVSGTANITISPAMNVPYLVNFVDSTDIGVFQNFSITNYTSTGFTVFWNSSPYTRTVTWFAIDGNYNPGAVYKHGQRTTSAVSINTNDYVITYIGTSSIVQPLFAATGSNRELVFTNNSSNMAITYTISATSGTIGTDKSVTLYDTESLTVFDAAANVWEIH